MNCWIILNFFSSFSRSDAILFWLSWSDFFLRNPLSVSFHYWMVDPQRLMVQSTWWIFSPPDFPVQILRIPNSNFRAVGGLVRGNPSYYLDAHLRMLFVCILFVFFMFGILWFVIVKIMIRLNNFVFFCVCAEMMCWTRFNDFYPWFQNYVRIPGISRISWTWVYFFFFGIFWFVTVKIMIRLNNFVFFCVRAGMICWTCFNDFYPWFQKIVRIPGISRISWTWVYFFFGIFWFVIFRRMIRLHNFVFFSCMYVLERFIERVSIFLYLLSNICTHTWDLKVFLKGLVFFVCLVLLCFVFFW